MSVSYAANKLRVPPGFEHLLEGLAREILREQPKNLLEFAAEYFRKKLRERDGEAAESAPLSTGEQAQLTQHLQKTSEDTVSASVVTSETPGAVTGTENTPQVPVTAEEMEKATGQQQGSAEEMEQREDIGMEEGGEENKGEVVGGDKSEIERVCSGEAIREEDTSAGNDNEKGEGQGEEEQRPNEGEAIEVEENKSGTEVSTEVDMDPRKSSENLPEEVQKEADPSSDALTEQPISSQQELSDVGSVEAEDEGGKGEEREEETEGERGEEVTEQQADDTVKDLTD